MPITRHYFSPWQTIPHNCISGTAKMSIYGWAAMMSTTWGKIKSEKISEEGTVLSLHQLFICSPGDIQL